MLSFCFFATVSAALVRPSPRPAQTSGPGGLPSRVGPGAVQAPPPLTAAPDLIPYDPLADPAAVVVASSGGARFTVLTDRLIRMEQSSAPFEDRSTLAVLNRKLPVPSFTHSESGGVLTITTASVALYYTLGQPFSPTSLTVKGVDAGSAFKHWSFGDSFPGNLLGTIRGQDGQSATPLNCTLNANVDDNGEYNHCEWGLVSRDGWVVYDDTPNVCLDGSGWWSTTGGSRSCGKQMASTDAANPANSAAYPTGTTVADAGACCAACLADPGCTGGYVFDTNTGESPNCWPLASVGGEKAASNRILSLSTNPASNTDAHDLYGLFHGHDYFGAIADYTKIGGKTIMVPRYASGIWNSRWYDYSSQDNLKLVDDYESRRIPLDVFVIDMCVRPNTISPPPRLRGASFTLTHTHSHTQIAPARLRDWHKKNDWSGFTFDPALYPSPEDAMAYLKALGMGITINIHDASGVNNWELMFPELAAALGLPAGATKVPFNLVNASVAYAVEDIVLGDLLYKKFVDFMWSA